MNESQHQHLEKLRKTHLRRLQILEQQAASFGSSTPPHILIEIEDIQQKLFSTNPQLASNISSSQNTSEEHTVILFLSSNPSETAHLHLGQELRDINERLQLSKHRDSFTLESCQAIRPEDITQAILDFNPKVVQFSGHGGMKGLCIEDVNGNPKSINLDALAALFKLVADRVTCVILNACYSEKQAEAIAQHIPYVIGMSQEIGDKAAIIFSVGFYKALGAGRTIEQAYQFGCIEIQLQGISEHLTPVLLHNE